MLAYRVVFLFLLLFLPLVVLAAKVDKISMALMLAVEKNQLDDVIKILTEHGGNPSTVNHYSISILHTAVSQGNADIVQLLLNHKASVNYALDSRAGHREGEAPLHFAAADNQPEVATLLLQAGADPKQMTAGGMTPLHLAAGLGHVDFIRQLKPFITAQEVTMPGENRYGSQPIHLAATSMNPEVVALLLEMGSSANVPNKKNSYPLHGAAIVGDVETARILLEAGADHSRLNGEGLTPLQVAEKRMASSEADAELKKNMHALRAVLQEAQGASAANSEL